MRLLRIKLILAFLITIHSSLIYADSEIFKAVREGNNDKVLQLLSTGTDINERDKLDWTPLFEAISWSKINTAKLLIEKKSAINIVNNEGNTPLHLASFLGHTEIVYLLVKKGANINAKNNEGQTPLFMAIAGKIEIAEFLLKNGAEQNPDKYGKTPLERAYSKESKSLLKSYQK